jgi:hypothetical protein
MTRAKRNLVSASSSTGRTNPRILSVLLNPSAPDSLAPDGVRNLNLLLSYGDDGADLLPLSDYVWFSDMPPVRLLSHMKNPEN